MLAPARRPWQWLAARPARGLWLALVLVAALRLPLVTESLGGDEGGYLMIARQWPGPGHWLYGGQWVDRPPLLMLTYEVAALVGGSPVALRLVALVLAMVLVTACWWAGRHIAGGDGAVAAALTAAALAGNALYTKGNQLSSDLVGATCVAVSVALLVAGLQATGRRSLLLCGAAGAAGVLAVLGKQSALTGLAVGAVLLVGGRRWRPLPAYVVGAAAPLVATLVWAATGPGVPMLVDALLTFRVRSAQVMATLTPHEADQREHTFALTFAASGFALLLVVLAVDVVGRRGDRLARAAVAVAVACVIATTVASLNWYHYYLQAAVPVAALGLAVAFRPGGRWGGRRTPLKAVVGVVVVAAVAGVAMSLSFNTGAHAEARYVAAAARPGDTVTVSWGQPSYVLETGLRTPYPYSWSLPVRVEDPRLAMFDRLLAGPHAPTWLVQISPWRLWHLGTPRVYDVVAAHYHEVALVCGHRIYLHDGVRRALGRARRAVRGVGCRAGVA